MIKGVVVFVVLPVPACLDQNPGIGAQVLKEFGLSSPSFIKLSESSLNPGVQSLQLLSCSGLDLL